MPYRRARLAGALAVACLALAPGVAHAAAIPTPEQFFGFEMGTEGKLPTWEKTKQYAKLIGDRSNKADYFVQSKTAEGDDYPVLLISSPNNLANIDKIVAANERLANPKGLTEEDAKALVAQSKPTYLIESTIHSTEVANMPAIIDAIHHFATDTSADTKQVLDNVVLVVAVSGNPDGWKKVVDYFDETANTSYTRTYPDLYHHYAGHDDNRDWYVFTQPETRARVSLEEKYHPVVEHVLHQKDATTSRIFMPPYQEPVSNNLDPITHESANALGLEVGKSFLAAGYKGIQHSMGTQNSYGIMFTADVAGYSSFVGTSLFLTETASQRDLAYPYTQAGPLGPQGRSMDNPDPYKGNTWTLKQASDYAELGLYAATKSVARNSSDWLYNNVYLVAKHSYTWSDGPYAYVLPSGQRDPYALYELLKIFDFGKAEIDRATAPFTAGGKSYPAGSYILRTQQPLGRWINQLLDNAAYPDWARPCATCPLTMPYSEFTDSVALMFGVDVQPVQAAFSAPTERVTEVKPEGVLLPQAPAASGAYLVEPSSYGVASLLAQLQKWDVPAFRSAAQFSSGARTFAPGTVIVPPSARSRMVLEDVAKSEGLPVYASDTVPAVAGFKLKPGTRVGLVRGANNMPGGWMMWLLEHSGIDYKVVSADDYPKLDALYDTIILADGITRARIVNGLDMTRYPAEWSWARGVGEAGWSQLAAFVRGGGNLVALGSASETAQALLNLPIQKVATTSPFQAGGVLLRESFDSSVPAAWGMPAEWVTWFDSDRAWNVSDPKARIAGAYPGTGNLLASGYEQGADQLRGKADIVELDVDKGHVTLSGSEITFRSWPRALWTVVANAIYQGPSTAVTAAEMKAMPAS
ncbi:M14 family zinc carboxypeptidase [Candidatus Solirubrobacter pratensis]|uniref:M14 family zinc carboxypeptidase n=1 Tax=Candidatus Solirubrobacter pratensis TaxID=1298857 RepID=UPI0003F5124C|nr:M14 family zinc carboxypeptidase [Candidatus Solirubrobacter pratensis]